jgi:hypothetical protein
MLKRALLEEVKSDSVTAMYSGFVLCDPGTASGALSHALVYAAPATTCVAEMVGGMPVVETYAVMEALPI